METRDNGHERPVVHITIDGQAVVARQGQTILEAARGAGIRIPTLCYLERLEPIGSCRLCVVEVAGTPTPATACTTGVQEEMAVQTHTPFLEEMRRETLKLLLARYPLNCGACEIDGDCELQNLVREYDIDHQDLHDCALPPLEWAEEKWATPLLKYHPRRCIVCGRCVAACGEITGAYAIALEGRGAAARIAPANESACVSCGECMAVCPTRALVASPREEKGKAWQRQEVKTICSYCGVGCEIFLDVRGNRVVDVRGSESGVNRGALCVKGRFGHEFIHHPERLRRPLVRRDGAWVEAEWDEALDLVAGKLQEIISKHGPDAVAGLASARATNEDNYIFQKLLRGVVGTNNVDHCARL